MNKLLLVGLLWPMVWGLVGCTEADRRRWDSFWGVARPTPVPAPGPVAAAANRINVRDLARQLQCRVVASSEYSATLLDAKGSTITLIGDPGGAVIVNGKSVPPGGRMDSVDGSLRVPKALVGRIRLVLMQERREPVVPAPSDPTVDGVRIIQPRPQHGPRLGPVLVDPGHGGRDNGTSAFMAVGSRQQKVLEKEINLATALAVARLLKRRNVTVHLTRNNDSYLSKYDRAKMANRLRVKLMVSIHADAAPNNSSATGYTVYVGRKPLPGSAAAAQAIDRRLGALGIDRRGVRKHEKGIVVLEQTRCPSVLVEQGYLTHAVEVRKLARVDYRNELAEAIADGVVDYLRQEAAGR